MNTTGSKQNEEWECPRCWMLHSGGEQSCEGCAETLSLVAQMLSTNPTDPLEYPSLAGPERVMEQLTWMIERIKKEWGR